LTGADNAANYNCNYNRRQFVMRASNGDGGTGTGSATGRGAVFGLPPVETLPVRRTCSTQPRWKLNVFSDAASSGWLRECLSLVPELFDNPVGWTHSFLMSLSSGQANVVDAAISINKIHGANPIKSTGAVMKARSSAGRRSKTALTYRL